MERVWQTWNQIISSVYELNRDMEKVVEEQEAFLFSLGIFSFPFF